jgi:hypothetical protein
VGRLRNRAIAVVLAAKSLAGVAGAAVRPVSRDVRRVESERVAEDYRTLLRESSELLQQLGDPATDPRLERSLRSSACEVSARVRRVMHLEYVPAAAGLDLAGFVSAAVEGFDDLTVDLAVDLARGVHLPVDVAATVEQAITSLLHALRRDGRAEHVLIHADVDRVRGRWEVVVREDGPSAADHIPVALEVGHDLRARLTPVGVEVQVVSHWEEGSAVTFRGPLESAAQVVL